MPRRLSGSYSQSVPSSVTGSSRARFGGWLHLSLFFWLALPWASSVPAALLYEDNTVLTYRMVITESESLLAVTGDVLNEAKFNEKLAKWRSDPTVTVLADSGFQVPAEVGILIPDLEVRDALLSATRRFGHPSPGVTLRLGATAEKGEWRTEVSFATAGYDQFSVAESLAIYRKAVRETGPDSPALPARKLRENGAVDWRGITPLQQVTAIVNGRGGGVRCIHTVFLMPLAVRAPLMATRGEPRVYDTANFRAVRVEVPSASFWSLMQAVRPDLPRAEEEKATVLEVFWDDEKWGVFSRGLVEAGHRFWEEAPILLNRQKRQHRLFSADIGMIISLPPDLPSKHFVLESGTRGLKGETTLESRREPLCETHDRRWTLVVRSVSETTYILALRSEFPSKSSPSAPVAVTKEAAATGGKKETTSASSSSPVPSLKSPARPLDLYSGEWVGTLDQRPDSRVRVVCNWNAKGTELLRNSRAVADASRPTPVYTSTVMWHDSATGKFHSRVQNEQGAAANVADGEFLPEIRTFVWTAIHPDTGATMVTHTSFPADGLQEWTQVTYDKFGHVMGTVSGKNTRQRN